MYDKQTELCLEVTVHLTIGPDLSIHFCHLGFTNRNFTE